MADAPRLTRVTLRPDLSRCIETTARQEFERSLRLLLEGKGRAALAERAELLRLFLETADFSELRRLSEPPLMEGRTVTFTLYREAGKARYRMRVSQRGKQLRR